MSSLCTVAGSGGVGVLTDPRAAPSFSSNPQLLSVWQQMESSVKMLSKVLVLFRIR